MKKFFMLSGDQIIAQGCSRSQKGGKMKGWRVEVVLLRRTREEVKGYQPAYIPNASERRERAS